MSRLLGKAMFRLRIVGISGNAGAGKDFLTRSLLVPMITSGHPYAIASFADHFKVEAIVKEGLDPKKVYGRKDKHHRVALQRKGTEEGRNVFGPNIWVDILDQRIQQYDERGIKFVFITDCRFPNEIEYVTQRGGEVIRIEAPDRHEEAMAIESQGDQSVKVHPSETALIGTKWPWVINNEHGNRTVATQAANIAFALREKWKHPVTVFCDLDDTIVTCSANYHKVKAEVKSIMLEEKLYTSEEYDRIFDEENNKRLGGVFDRWSFGEMFVEILCKANPSLRASSLAERVFQIGMSVYEMEFAPISKETIEYISHLDRTYNLVIVTLGDPVDQNRKLFNAGLFGLNVECVWQKNTTAYVNLMKKYYSDRYVMIGDSLKNDIGPAIAAGITETYHITHEKPITGIGL